MYLSLGHLGLRVPKKGDCWMKVGKYGVYVYMICTILLITTPYIPQHTTPVYSSLSYLIIILQKSTLITSLPPLLNSSQVGGERRSWLEGKLLVLDTSFTHETYNESEEEDRYVLILDFWLVYACVCIYII